jgi:SpoU rRNA methylase family enzyme
LVIEGWKINQKFVAMKFKKLFQGKLHERQQGALHLAGSLKIIPVVILSINFLLVAFSTHPYYVSVSELEYKPAQKEIQIAFKVFTDDLEDALKAETKQKILLTEDKEEAAKQILINNYLQQHFKLMIDGKKVTYEFIGFENEQEATWNYLLVKNVSGFKSVTVFNDVFYDLRSGQINILHFKHLGKTKSYRLTAPENQYIFSW